MDYFLSVDVVSLADKDTGDLYSFNITTGNISSILRQNIIVNFTYDDSKVLKQISYDEGKVDVIYNDNNIVAMNLQESPEKIKTW
jgi:hypothetical protein